MTIPSGVFEQTVASFFAPIASLLQDDEVSEILINRHDTVFVERAGSLHPTPHGFPSEYALMSALRNLSQYVGRELGPRSPVLEARLPDGSRVQAIIPPAAPDGPTVCIRRFRGQQLTLRHLEQLGAVTARCAALLRSVIRQRANVLIGGGSGTGKTCLLNALASLARESDRVIAIEDSKELQLALPHVVYLEAQPPNRLGRGAVSIRELFRATLRMRPDRIVIGEIRGGEAVDLIQAMTSGHRGCLSTLHGTLPEDTLGRLETMALMSDVAIPVTVLRAQIASAIDVVVQVARAESGMRRVTHVFEVVGFDRDRGFQFRDLLEGAAAK